MKTILFVDIPGHKELPCGEVLNPLFHHYDVKVVNEFTAAQKIISDGPIHIFIANCAEYDIFSSLRKTQPACHIILATDRSMESYSEALRNEEELLLDHVIASRALGFWTPMELRTTVEKICSPQDIFGVDKYLLPSTPVQQLAIANSGQRNDLNQAVQQFAIESKLGQHFSKLAFGITEEMLTNVIYDAPEAANCTAYGTIDRNKPLSLNLEHQGLLSFGCDGRILAIAASDPFGRLRKDKLYSYLKKVLRRKDSVGLIDNKKGGAGLGFFKILYSSHGLVCNVTPGKKTEIIALIDTDEQIRDFSNSPRSIHYFLSA